MDPIVADRLRCPEPHEETPLIVRADRITNGRIVEGAVGCHLCRREWPVTAGVMRFGDPRGVEAIATPEPVELAAFLGLTRPGMVVLADGADVGVLAALESDYGAIVVAADPPAPARLSGGFEGGSGVPIRSGMADGVVLLRPESGAAFVATAMAALAGGGRVVAAGAIDAAGAADELGRDGRVWVGERRRAAAPVQLRRRQ